MLGEEACRKRWKHQTLHRHLCSVVGALANLPLYSNVPCPVTFRFDPEFKAALGSIHQDAQQSQPSGQTAASVDHMAVAVEEEPTLWVQAALIIMWVTCARPGCILQLRPEDVTLDIETGLLTINFRAGKGVKLRGPYTVPAHLASTWKEIVDRYLRARTNMKTNSPLLFPPVDKVTTLNQRMPTMLRSLRVANPALNMRSMRRGSLQTLAMSGMPIKQVMERAGHTNERTTRRYLDWGRLDGEAIFNALDHGHLLQPSTIGPVTFHRRQ